MMKSIIKGFVQLLPESLKRRVYSSVQKSRDKKIIAQWQKDGSHVPAPHQVKQMIIRGYGKKHAIRTMIETGTYYGDMVEAQRGNFAKIFSIELSTDLWKKAFERFQQYPGIKILQGDSGVVLHKIMPEITQPALFWLDGHFSEGVTAKGDKDCPIYEELGAIFKAPPQDHVILIDDARCFVGRGDYPTIEDLSNYIRSKDPRYKMEVAADIIRITVR
jgi:hypothetical protein